MKENLDMRKIAIENLDVDIRLLAFQSTLKKDSDLIETILLKKLSLIETILLEKLNLLYTMDIINIKTYHIYIKTIRALKEEN